MSSRALAVLAAVTALATGAPARAQVGALERDVVQRLDSLVPLLRQAEADFHAAQARLDSTLRAAPRERVDTLRIGLARVVTFPDEADMARSVVGEAWSVWGDMASRSPALERTAFSFHWSPRRRTVTLDEPARRIEAPAWRSRGFLVANAVELLGSVLGEDLQDTPVGDWVSGGIRPPLDPPLVYRYLAATPSRANRACTQGDARSCWTALGLDLSDDPWSAWYTPEELRARAVEELGRPRGYPPARQAARRCADGDLEVCRQLLARLGHRRTAPLPNEARRSLLWVALQAGGSGALDRLLEDPARSPEDALRAASGLEPDALAARWLAWVQANRPTVYAGLATTGATTLFWLVGFALLAMRSTRWRSS